MIEKNVVVALNLENEFVANIYKLRLDKLGIDTHITTSPKDMLLWLKSNKPSLLITGLLLPDYGGIELVQKVRKLYTKGELPIAVMSNISRVDIVAECLDAGANLHIDQHAYTPSQVMDLILPFIQRKP